MTKKNELINQLKLILADTYCLYLKTQSFHWNVTGSNFFSLHELTETQYKELANAIDDIAERIRTMGEKVHAGFKEFESLTTLKTLDINVASEDLLNQLITDHIVVINHLNKTIKIAQGIGDEGTIDLLIARLKSHEKTNWMLKSSL